MRVIKRTIDLSLFYLNEIARYVTNGSPNWKRIHGYMRTTLFASILLAICHLSAFAEDKPATNAAAATQSSWKYSAKQLMMPDGKLVESVPTAQKALYKIVDDDKAEGGKALQVRADTQVLFS